MNAEKKVAFRVTGEQAAHIEKLKQEIYFNKSYSDLYRDLISKGIEAVNQRKKGA